MQYSTNLNMNLPERADQYNLDHWNENTNILDTEIQNIKDLNDNTLKTSLLNFCYPVGSLYWSSKATDPSTLFGGTWTPIKDRFVWAKGDNDTVNDTGGAKTVTLTTEQIPSHTHTFTGSAVTSGANSRGHTHSVTASGTVSGGAYKFSGTRTTTESGGVDHTHGGGTLDVSSTLGGWRTYGTNAYGTGAFSTNTSGDKSVAASYTGSSYYTSLNFSLNGKWTGATGGASAYSHSHYYTPSGSISITTNPSFTGSAVTSDGESQNHTHSVTASGTNSSVGGGQAHDNMPPYIVKYCWERTA